MLNGAKKCSRNSTEIGEIWSTTSLLTKHRSIRMSPKATTHRLGILKWTETNKSCSFTQCCQANDCFFGYTGQVTTVALEDRRIVNIDWYTTICLPEVINELRRTNRRNRCIILHHDNASCHTARQTVDFL